MRNFWSYVDIKGTNDCWNWKSSKDKDGYGKYKMDKKYYRAHRYAYVLEFGSIPTGLNVLHRCDNPSCCNPNHLWVGTVADNNHDAQAKGRSSYAQAINFLSGNDLQKGSNSWKTNLTEVIVLQIRQERANGVKLQELADRYGVAERTIEGIVYRKTWTHI